MVVLDLKAALRQTGEAVGEEAATTAEVEEVEEEELLLKWQEETRPNWKRLQGLQGLQGLVAMEMRTNAGHRRRVLQCPRIRSNLGRCGHTKRTFFLSTLRAAVAGPEVEEEEEEVHLNPTATTVPRSPSLRPHPHHMPLYPHGHHRLRWGHRTPSHQQGRLLHGPRRLQQTGLEILTRDSVTGLLLVW